jgi:hypothetical protein
MEVPLSHFLDLFNPPHLLRKKRVGKGWRIAIITNNYKKLLMGGMGLAPGLPPELGTVSPKN